MRPTPAPQPTRGLPSRSLAALAALTSLASGCLSPGTPGTTVGVTPIGGDGMVLTDGYSVDGGTADTVLWDAEPPKDGVVTEVSTHDVPGPSDVPGPGDTLDGGVDACAPQCAGKQCGPDGCGGFCGTCADGAHCTPVGQCVSGCVPDCAGKQCGGDGCGGQCGTCADTEMCDEFAFLCVPYCSPYCAPGWCGDDGCGGTCNGCVPGEVCDQATGQCVEECVPQCPPGSCGDDGCGGSCGGCAADSVCVNGVCAPDPCQPNPCTLPPAAICQGQTAVTWLPEGLCEPSPYGAAPHCTYQIAGQDSCADQGLVCATGKCVPPGDPTTYDPSPSGSYVTELRVANQQGNPVCCFDLTGDGVIDNALGDLLDTASGLLGGGSGVDEDLSAAIQSGALAMIFEWKGLDVPPGGPGGTLPEDDAVEVNLFQGTGGTYDGSLDGDGTWTVTPGSFVPGTAQPAGAVGAGSIHLGEADVGPGNITLPLPLLGVVTDVQIAPAYMAGTTFWGNNLVGLDVVGGKLGGAVPIGAVYAAFNAYVDSSCGCLGLPDGLISLSADGAGQCNQPTGSCGGSSCDQLAQVCPLVLNMISPDLDVDGDGTYDSLSVGLMFQAVSTNIVGVAP